LKVLPLLLMSLLSLLSLLLMLNGEIFFLLPVGCFRFWFSWHSLKENNNGGRCCV